MERSEQTGQRRRGEKNLRLLAWSVSTLRLSVSAGERQKEYRVGTQACLLVSGRQGADACLFRRHRQVAEIGEGN